VEGSLKRLKTDVIDLYYQHRVDSSVAVHKVTPTAAVYAATKHAVWALSEGLRQEVKPYDIRTTVISPGAVATELARVLLGAKTYAKHTLKSAITVGFSTFEGRSHVLAKQCVDVWSRIANLRTVLLTMGCILRQV
jgi:short-subunit dehydrogenase